MSRLDDRADRRQRITIRDKCLKKAVQLAAGLDDIQDATQYNRAVNTIQALSTLALAISARDG
jgi:hypothetical protein